LGFDGGVKVT